MIISLIAYFVNRYLEIFFKNFSVVKKAAEMAKTGNASV